MQSSLPQGVAFATLAGMPPEYASVRRDGAVHWRRCSVLAAMVTDRHRHFADDAGASRHSQRARLTALHRTRTDTDFSGRGLQLALGLHAGCLIDLVPHSVIVGFTAGAAILIINSQIGPFLGLGLPRGTSVIDNVRAVWRTGRTSILPRR